MIFSREITEEEMNSIVSQKSSNPSFRPCVYLLECDNEHGYASKDLYRTYSVPVPVVPDKLSIDTNTGEKAFIFSDDAPYVRESQKIYPTLEDVNNEIKRISAFWEVVGMDRVIGWNLPEARVVEAKKKLESAELNRIMMQLDTPPTHWKLIVEEGKRDLETLEGADKEELSKALTDFEERARKYYGEKEI